MVQAICHNGFHDLKLSHACAMAGGVPGGQMQEFSGSLTQDRRVFRAHQVKTAHQHIRPKGLCDLDDALVGAAGEQYGLFPLLNAQVLLMAKILRLPIQKEHPIIVLREQIQGTQVNSRL